MTDLRKAAEMALEALESLDCGDTYKTHNAASALRQALAQPEQEWDSRHPKAQALIGERARLRIELGLVERLVDDPHFETTPSDMEYWGPLHDKLEEALTQPKQEPVFYVIQATDRFGEGYEQTYWEDPNGFPVYAAPVHASDISQERVDETGKKRHEWVGLDPEQMRNTPLQFNRGALWAERYLKEKNNG